MKELLGLSVQLQAILVSGYIGYVIAQRDYRKNERKTDMWLGVFLFGLPAGICLTLTDSPVAYLGVLLAPLLAWLWATRGKGLVTRFFNSGNVAYETNEGDVWHTLSTRKGVIIKQITATLKNGRKYMCTDTAKFKNAEFSPCIIDDDGIAFYVDKFINSKGEWATDDEVLSSFGDIVTYFPRNDIALLEVRYKKE